MRKRFFLAIALVISTSGCDEVGQVTGDSSFIECSALRDAIAALPFGDPQRTNLINEFSEGNCDRFPDLVF